MIFTAFFNADSQTSSSSEVTLIAKTHVCETEAILQTVLADLKSRGVTINPTILPSPSLIHIDFGGCMVAGAEPIQAGTIRFFAQHYPWLKQVIDKAQRKGDRGGYFKIHAQRAVCVTPETFHQLVTFCNHNDAHLQHQCAISSQDLAERIAHIQQQQI